MEPMTSAAEVVHEHGDTEGLGNRLNWLRAGVLGANDGIVSVAGIVMVWRAPPTTVRRS
jgi:VIT1/CCC1 family predicted Fe2+/Mn2+ transporter